MKATHVRKRRVSASVQAQAAAWIARLHGPNRTKEVEEGLRRWLAEESEHAEAFELLTDLWEKAAYLSRARIAPISSSRPVRPRVRVLRAALVAVVMALVAAGDYHMPNNGVVTTGIDQFRSLILADGTRIRMDADTKLDVRYGARLRRVVIEQGQAYFHVVHRSDWPFIVIAAGHDIRDVGTKFDVRRQGDLMAVTLLQGEVTVSREPSKVQPIRAPAAAGQRGGRPRGAGATGAPRTITLAPGERVTFQGTRMRKIDWPSVAQVTAWLRGEVMLENTSLADAAADLNRYSRLRIVIRDPAVASIRVSGVVQAGASRSFAAAVARSYRLRELRLSRNVIILESDR